MGSTNVYSDEEINVLITGFGPFKKEYPLNPSWEIASRLPAILPPLRAKQPSTQKPPLIPRVNLHVHPDPIRVSYKTVRALIPKLWAPTFDSSSSPSPTSPSSTTALAEPTSEAPFSEQDAAAITTTEEEKPTTKYDFAIHIGMAGPQPRWAIERLAHRDGYALRDVDGEFLRDKENQLKDDWVWKGCPAELRTDLDLDVILEKWRGYAPPGLVGKSQGGEECEDEKEGKNKGEGGKGAGGGGGAKWYGNDIKGGNKGEKLVISEDPGRYLCDFIYYSSLAELYKRKAEKKVVFLHVPCEVGKDGEYVRIGQELMLGLARSVAEWLVEERKRKGDLR
ncbi:hypothetical protein NEUTE1DRAFT_125177 [Neurospora tetrasperma FGSC 2508]|uniref:Peptidase C15, pyroglutamyl peptidase I-like protein n=1 Tax=Neurospora tetrasperma (strain FGSC 2508 / ATCC MYA-4615 / P0657) TaxID=510951 RepID=F8MXZ7_NEUT8|nr:uncharacterized protein NEUTE1DRAFT_125177 [Neurospora tetrasperma FGSC 2508]EGO51479.1 hypothetical protein NEUTE1DRAFT_125177 [Neurospora tetrasperma FGSC 2508]EGZ78538.1 peptidase C15, pyroglutamyl peptidase I-like protein [Neurospora tetrasperma FGSC 2509]